MTEKKEEQRSKLWRVLMFTSTIVLIFVAVFFITKIFIMNPLAGSWQNDGGNFTIVFQKEGQVEIQFMGQEENSNLTIPLNYSMDKKNKIVNLQINQKQMQKLEKMIDTTSGETDISSILRLMNSSFEYSVDGKNLTLTDREYGEQIFFEQK